MNENKRMLILVGAIAIIIGLILVISFWPEKDTTFACGVKKDKDYTNLAAVNYDDYNCLKDEKEVILAVGDLSKSEKKNLNKVGEEADMGIYYLSDEISSSELKKIKKQLTYSDDAFKKDVLLIMKKGKVDSYKEDVFASSDSIYSFLEEKGVMHFACGVQASEEFKNLGIINYDDYKCLYDRGKIFILVVAQTTCSHCINFEPVINEYAGEKNIPVYVINVDELSEDEFTEFTGSLSYFAENEQWGTPLTLAIKDKKVVAKLNGEVDATAIDSFVKEAGIK